MVFIFLITNTWLASATPVEEMIHDPLMQTAFISLIHKASVETDDLHDKYAERMFEDLITQHPHLAELSKQIGRDPRAGDYIRHRSSLFDQMLERILSLPEPPDTLVALASGFDSRPLRYHRYFKTIIEVDLQAVTQLKQAIYQRTELGQDHQMIAGDIISTEWFDQIPKEGVLFTLEGILPYLDEEQAHTVFSQLATAFHNSHILAETLPSYMIATASLAPTAALARWLLTHREETRNSVGSFLSDHSVVSPSGLQLWAQHLPSDRVTLEEYTTPKLNIQRWKSFLIRLLGVEQPRISWLRIH
ncbi:class I SAM-dependent methyltransferase [Parendozoicomonas haliclonae]|uniref:class I SAM-dependent methyltransferase n=1 Tax=Parendozoicomonas haliclonae TaxID=1960125 RepID=UPI0013FDDC89|nr:class I SAM-dependent methyltransferase [Parendozoicomonas haliclonae]